jgi:hypothetical protein
MIIAGETVGVGDDGSGVGVELEGEPESFVCGVGGLSALEESGCTEDTVGW